MYLTKGLSMSINSIPSNAKPVLTMAFAQGKTTQQTFSAIRAAGFNLSYQQVANFKSHQEAQFNNAFEAIFRS